MYTYVRICLLRAAKRFELVPKIHQYAVYSECIINLFDIICIPKPISIKCIKVGTIICRNNLKMDLILIAGICRGETRPFKSLLLTYNHRQRHISLKRYLHRLLQHKNPNDLHINFCARYFMSNPGGDIGGIQVNINIPIFNLRFLLNYSQVESTMTRLANSLQPARHPNIRSVAFHCLYERNACFST